MLRLRGGGKKRKKKTYTKPKKVKHVHKSVKLAVLKFYRVDDNGKVQRLRKYCPDEQCGVGVRMAVHKDRFYCGKCGLTVSVASQCPFRERGIGRVQQMAPEEHERRSFTVILESNILIRSHLLIYFHFADFWTVLARVRPVTHATNNSNDLLAHDEWEAGPSENSFSFLS